MRQHRHAARPGGQSACQAGQRRPTGTSAEKFSTNARLPSEPTPKSKKEKPVTLARGNGRTNHRRATGCQRALRTGHQWAGSNRPLGFHKL